ncbi:mitochondrial processing peptidase [Melampsora larici-populina 98AG31]|uniref:Mitochondrial processing peptidase n=1 Tax=Melampsora larici-populina (strain 98AG31 / pathotype 3-4-7) TaxID=747676 RepID=F4R8G7_MELLP|nr:mitochondrial processing peptidase [Melampsora larici-populina 98AG31]EGG11482.1 mitochondrial processing peptidase [Melampsora larici-populina 98AG31]
MKVNNYQNILSILSNRTRTRTRTIQKNYSTSSSSQPITQTSILPNGIKVATESTPGHFIGIGVYIDAGSRYESHKLRGVTHLTDRMAFKSTQTRTKDQIGQEIESLGGSFFASSGRDTIVYQATSYPNSINSVLSILSDTSLNPLLTKEELEIEKLSTEWEVNEINKNPEYMIPEVLHEIAFPKNTLGLPLICPKDRISKISTDLLWEYRSWFYKPNRIVLAAVGVNHHEFLIYANEHFGKFNGIQFDPSTSSSSSTKNHNQTSNPINLSPINPLTGKPLETFEELINAKPYYQGGEMRIPDEESKLAHLYIGFEAPHIHDEDLYAIACAHIMLGGGSSFSAGGPGKGMYSRLYTRVLNPHPEVDFCQAFHHSYSDSGLFGIGMSVVPEFVDYVPEIIGEQLNLISKPMIGSQRNQRNGINQNELNRAKNQLRSTMMYGLESRVLQVEDLGRQIQSSGRKRPWNEIWKSIEALTIEDIHRVISKIIRPEQDGFSGEPTIVATGQIGKLGNVKERLNRMGIGSLKDRSKVWW